MGHYLSDLMILDSHGRLLGSNLSGKPIVKPAFRPSKIGKWLINVITGELQSCKTTIQLTTIYQLLFKLHKKLYMRIVLVIKIMPHIMLLLYLQNLWQKILWDHFFPMPLFNAVEKWDNKLCFTDFFRHHKTMIFNVCLWASCKKRTLGRNWKKQMLFKTLKNKILYQNY